MRSGYTKHSRRHVADDRICACFSEDDVDVSKGTSFASCEPHILGDGTIALQHHGAWRHVFYQYIASRRTEQPTMSDGAACM